jgi:AMP deaminase
VHPHEVVLEHGDGQKLTLTQVFEQMGLDPYDLNLASLGMAASGSGNRSAFANLDKFSLKYNPMGKSPVGRVFLRQENLLRGRYFAELTRELFDNLVWVRVRVRVRVRVSY